MPDRIYLDYNATTPVAPDVLAAMLPHFAERFGNASSAHAWGWAAAEAVEAARAHVAALIGAEAQEIVFTSGATEACTLAVRGVAVRYAAKGRHLVVGATEHPAVTGAHAALAREGWSVTTVPVDARGVVTPDALAAALRPDTVLASVMAANNETGVMPDLPALAAVLRARGVLFFTDATQALGKVPVDAAHADLLAGSAHKLYGPLGVGFLYVRRKGPRVALTPVIEGGGQERGLRSGTLNAPGIVGLGAACARAAAHLDADAARLGALRDGLEARLVAEAGAIVHGAGALRLPNTLSVAFPGVRADRLVADLGGRLALATGSACASAKRTPSPVLLAMGVPEPLVRSTIRLSLGAPTTADEVAQAGDGLVAAVGAIRGAVAA